MRRRKEPNQYQIPISKGHDEQYVSKLRHAAAVALTAAIISSSVVGGPALAQRTGINPAPAPIIAAQAPEVTMGGMMKAGSVPYDESKMVADQSPALNKFLTSITSGALLPNVTLADQMVAGVGGNELGYSYGKEIADKLDKQNTPDAASPDKELAQAPDEKRGSGEGPGDLAGRDSDTPKDAGDPPPDSGDEPDFQTPSLGGQPDEMAQRPDTPAQAPDTQTAKDTPSQPEESSSYDPSGEIAQLGIPGTSKPTPVPEIPEPSEDTPSPSDSDTPSDTPSEPSTETPETELAQAPDHSDPETPSTSSDVPQETPEIQPSEAPETEPASDPDVEPTTGDSDQTPQTDDGGEAPEEDPGLGNDQGPPEWAGGPGGNPEAGPPPADDEQTYSPDEGTEELPDSEISGPNEGPGPPEWAGGPTGSPDSGQDTGDKKQAQTDQPQGPIGASDDTEETVDEYVETGDGDDALDSAENDISRKTGTEPNPSPESTSPNNQESTGQQPTEQPGQKPNSETPSRETTGPRGTTQTSTPAPTKARPDKPEAENAAPQRGQTTKPPAGNEAPALEKDMGSQPSGHATQQPASGVKAEQQKIPNARDPQSTDNTPAKPEVGAARPAAAPQHKNTASRPQVSDQSGVPQTAFVVESDGSDSTVQKFVGDYSEPVFQGPASYPEAIGIAMGAGAVPNAQPSTSDEDIYTPVVDPATDIANATAQAVEDPAATGELTQELIQNVETQISEITEQAYPDPLAEAPIPGVAPEVNAPQPYKAPVEIQGLQQDIQQTVDAQMSSTTAGTPQDAVVPDIGEPAAQDASVPGVGEQVYPEPDYAPATGYEDPLASEGLAQQIDPSVTNQVADVSADVAQVVPVLATSAPVAEPAADPYVEPVTEPVYEESTYEEPVVQQVIPQDLSPATQVAPQDLPRLPR